MSRFNPLLVWILTSPLHGLLSKGLMVLHIQGRRTGKRYTMPVGFQDVEGHLHVLVSKAPRKQWWRNFSTEAELDITLRRKTLPAKGSLIDKESKAFETLVLATLSKLPSLAKQLELEPNPKSKKEGIRALSAQEWRKVKQNVVAVRFEIQR